MQMQLGMHVLRVNFIALCDALKSGEPVYNQTNTKHKAKGQIKRHIEVFVIVTSRVKSSV
jgi:hypothetical protein